jgi:hypothetical protein
MSDKLNKNLLSVINEIDAIDSTIKLLEKSSIEKKLLLEKILINFETQLVTITKISEKHKPSLRIVAASEGDYAPMEEDGNRSPSPIHMDLKLDKEGIEKEINDTKEKLYNDKYQKRIKDLRRMKSEKETEKQEIKNEIDELSRKRGGKTKRRKNRKNQKSRRR